MSVLPAAVADRVSPLVGEVQRAEPIGGGCIAHATRIESVRGPFFLKWSEGKTGRTFVAEAVGLRVLRQAATSLVVPGVLAVEDAKEGVAGFLLMDWVERGERAGAFWEALGAGLADLHRRVSDDGRYGFADDNVIGRMPQYNRWAATWPGFFKTQRLEPQICWAREAGQWRPGWDRLADRLGDRLGDLLPETPPASLLHGDLWSGNVLASSDGRAVLIDPATYYGHRETDLALTELFGGFDAWFYDSYRAAWPLSPGYPERREVYNLYHLLNHLNLFGGSYAGGVERVLKRFG